MEKRLVLELLNHNVYYVKANDINYYITIPKNNEKSRICIELKSKMANYNLDMNDEIWVMENVKNTFSYIDEYNITLVLPILDESMTDVIEKIDSAKFEEIDKVLGMTINSAYSNLINEGKAVEPTIMLINNERYKTFINWFCVKYKERVECKTLLELIQYFNVNATSYKKIVTPGMTYVVGSYNTEINAPKIEKEPAPTEEINLVPQHSTGFSSYWLLVLVTIVVSIIIAVISFVY